MIPALRPATAAWVRLTTFNALKIAVTCTFTVFTDKSKAAAMVLFGMPSLNSCKISV